MNLIVCGMTDAYSEAFALLLGKSLHGCEAVAGAVDGPYCVPDPRVVVLVEPSSWPRSRSRDGVTGAAVREKTVVLDSHLTTAMAETLLKSYGKRVSFVDGSQPAVQMLPDLRLAVFSGGGFASATLSDRVTSGPEGLTTSCPESPLSRLSRRQRDTLVLIAKGASIAEIAARMGLSVRTVEKHMAAVYEQLGCNRVQAAITAVRDGLTTFDSALLGVSAAAPDPGRDSPH